MCNEGDDDCDGVSDNDAIDAPVWCRDADGDGFGDSRFPSVACTAPPDVSPNATDCDDTQADRFPGAPEVADDGVDQDCDGSDARRPGRMPPNEGACSGCDTGPATPTNWTWAWTGLLGLRRRAP